MNAKRKTAFYLNILLSITIMVIIFLFSTESGEISANRSGSLKESLLNLLSPVLPDVIINFLDRYIRQIAHFTLYFALGLTSSMAVREGFVLYYPKKTSILRICAIALVICVLYAISDEFHQYFVPGRSCRFIDVIIDTAGASLSITILGIINHISQRKKAT